jgi:hypothetical protein
MDELERMGIVGPAKGAEPREILIPLNVVPMTDSGRLGEPSLPTDQPPPGPPAPPEEPPSGGESEPPENRALLALREFYSRLELTAADGELLLRKRGLPAEAHVAFGFKSSAKANREILESLFPKYAEEELTEAGLWRTKDGKCKPEPQLYGFGNTGKKEKGELVWGWVHPILIPYFDKDGEVVAIRPHKGNVAGKPARLFVARFAKGWNQTDRAERTDRTRLAIFKPAHCVITEGEFKACALYWVFGGKAGVAALPGIQQSKNYAIFEELKDWLKNDCRPEKLIVAFDNEEKGDAKLPGFKPDKRKRFDAEIWARYLAYTLEQSFCLTRICRLPDNWRDANGNADWDSALARIMKTGGLAQARKEFSDALAKAVGMKELKQAKLFEAEDERIIQNGLDRLFYERELPNGGEKEFALARKLMKLANGSLKEEKGLGIPQLAAQYRETKGWYYTLKDLKDGARSRWMRLQQKENEKPFEDRNHDLIWFCELRLKGIPTRVANFRMECFHTLVRVDGKRDRVVQIVTERGERSKQLRLDSESFSTPSGRAGFRVWLANNGNGCWKAGERELQALQLDVAHDVAFMDVHERVAVGYDAESGLWLMGDCAYDKDAELLPDEDGVYWKDGIGYQLATTGSGNQAFRQLCADGKGVPLMHPGLVLQFGEAAKDGEVTFCLLPPREAAQEELPAVNRLFAELTVRLEEALGGYEAFLVAGAFMAYAGAPEFYRQERGFPGLFLHGETRQGKTTTMQWMMELWGFHQMTSDIGMSRNSSAVGMQIAAEQYSELPVWLTDYDNTEVAEEKRQIIHDAFNRALASKWAADGMMRKVRTMFVIDGESRPHKTSTRFRYAQVLISKMNRRSNQVVWFEKNRRFFFDHPGAPAEERGVWPLDDGEFQRAGGINAGRGKTDDTGAWGRLWRVHGGGQDVWRPVKEGITGPVH